MKWLRLRKTWSYGVDRWKYIPLFDGKDSDAEVKEEYIDPIINDMSWSEKFGGVEYDIIPTRSVPNMHIQTVCEHIKNHVKAMKEDIITETENLSVLRKLKGKGRKTDPDVIKFEKRQKRDKKLIKEATDRRIAGLK